MVAKGSVLFKNTISRSLQVSNEVKHKIIDNMPDFSRGLTVECISWTIAFGEPIFKDDSTHSGFQYSFHRWVDAEG